jgi:hypothetical protein
LRYFHLISLHIFIVSAWSGVAIAPAAGTLHPGNNSIHFAPALYVYYKFDEQTFIGIHTGRQQGHTPILGSAFVRLPFGRVLQPVFLGDIGLTLKNGSTPFTWKAGGGIDWKNGERTSILLFSGYEDTGGVAAVYTRLGLLLEF